MRIAVSESGAIEVIHKDSRIYCGDFKRPSSWKHKPEDLFKEINKYWSLLHIEEQNKIYEVYADMSALFSSERDPRVIMRGVQDIMVRLLDDLHPFDLMSEFVSTLDISIPDTAMADFDDSDGRKHRELTYIKSEYFDLVVSTIILRTILPVWNVFKDSQKVSETESKIYADMDVLRTLRYTDFIFSPPMHRLQVYVHAAYERQPERKAELSSIIAGIGSSDIPNYIYSSALSNRLIFTPIEAIDGKSNLISSVFMKVKHDTNTLGDKLNQRVLDSSNKNRMRTDEEDKIGYLEAYSVRQDVSDHIYLLNQVFLSDYRRARRHLDDEIPSALVKLCIESLHAYQPKVVRKDQITLTQWVLSRICHARALPYINREAMFNAMGLTQAALIYWGFPEIAVLISASPIVEDFNDDDDELVSGFATQLHALDANAKSEIAKAYPYYRPVRDKKTARQLWPGYIAIDAFTLLLTEHRWEINTNPELLQKLRVSKGEIRLHLQLRNLLAELLLKINRSIIKTDGE